MRYTGAGVFLFAVAIVAMSQVSVELYELKFNLKTLEM